MKGYPATIHHISLSPSDYSISKNNGDISNIVDVPIETKNYSKSVTTSLYGFLTSNQFTDEELTEDLTKFFSSGKKDVLINIIKQMMI